MQVAGLILAAGNSSRLGHNKQLVHINWISVIRRCVLISLQSKLNSVTVVSGFEHDKLNRELSDLPCDLRYHKNWSQGIGGSLGLGIQQIIMKSVIPQAVMVLLPDQFAVNHRHLYALINHAIKSYKTIIATAYSDTYGPPVIFKSDHFSDLAKFLGQQGAKKLIEQHRESLELVTSEGASLDLDTPDDLALLNNLELF